MNKELFTVDELAQILDVHPRTIRRYIRDGVLKGTKIGGQWRVKKEDLDMFMDNTSYIKEKQQETDADIKDFVDGMNSPVDGKIQVCSVIDFYADSASQVKPVCQALIDMMNSGDSDQQTARFQYTFIPEEKKARFTLWGNPKFIAKMLNAVADTGKN